MKTLCALVLVPLWQCLAEECSETLGSCAGKQASLMQFKSLNQKKQALSLEGQASFSSKLGEFQKFTNEMVDKYGDPASAEPSDSVKEAVHTVLDFIDDMFEHLNTYHEQDVALASRCADPQLYCVELYMDQDQSKVLKRLKSASAQAQLAHSSCLGDDSQGVTGPAGYQCGGIVHECNKACSINGECVAYDQGRGAKPENADIPEEAKLPLCVSAGDFADDHITAPTGSEDLGEMEQCLEDTKIWLDYLYPLYDNCHRGQDCCEEKVEQCDSLQTKFEQHRCTYATASNSVCSTIQTCREARTSECHEVCEVIERRSGARAADNETGERLVCLLHALFGKPNPTPANRSDFLPRPDAEQRPGELEKCKVANIVTDYWVIPCDESDSDQPADEIADRYECPLSDVTKPCTDEFTGEVYNKFRLALEPEAANFECAETAKRGHFGVINYAMCEENECIV